MEINPVKAEINVKAPEKDEKILGMLMSPCNLEFERWRQEDPEVRAVLSYTESETSLSRLEFPSSHLNVTQVSSSRTEMKCTTAATHTLMIAIMDINVPYFHDFKINSKGSKLLDFAVTSPHSVPWASLSPLLPVSYPLSTFSPFHLWPFNPPPLLHSTWEETCGPCL